MNTFNCIIILAFLLCESSFVGDGASPRNFLRHGAQLNHPFNVNHQQFQPIQRNCKKEVAGIGKDGHTSCVDLPSPKHGVPRRYLADKSPEGDQSDQQLLIPSDMLLHPPPSSSTTRSSPTTSPKNNNNRDVEGIIIIVGAISVVVIIVGLVLICWLTRGRKAGSEDKQRDDKPLLTSTSNDLSDGSPKNPTDKDFGRKGSFNNSSLDVTTAGNQEDVGNANGLQSEKSGPPPPPPPSAPPPPPPKKPAPPPPPKARPPPAPPGAKNRGRTASGDGGDPTGDSDAKRTKMKPFFWDKMAGNGNQSMVWDEIRGGSFVFNEEMMEALFGYNPDDRKPGDRRSRSAGASQPQYIQIIDPKKAQNLSILLKALNVTTEEVHDALVEGNELPAELLQNLLRMAPTQEEELKLRLFTGPLDRLGPADRFLKAIIEIPFAFKRMESLVFMITFKEEVSNVKESYSTLEVACDELKKSRLFLKLLEAVLKTGNRMNDGTYRGGAQAFKLDTLLKLADVKGLDGKTTLLHFVVQEIVRTEGMKAVKAARENRRISSIKSEEFVAEDPPLVVETENYNTLGLKIVSSISSELGYVKKAAIIDGDVLTTTVSKLNQSLVKIKDFISNDMPSDTEEQDEFFEAITSFVSHSEGEVAWLQEEERRISELVKKTTDYFHGSSGRDEGLRLFVVVRDFLRLLDRICAELQKSFAQQTRTTSKERSPGTSIQDQQQSLQEMRRRLFPTISPKQVDESSSDDDDDSNSISKKTQTPSKEMSPKKATQDQKKPMQDMRQRLAPAIAPKRVEDESSSDSDSDDSKCSATPSKEMPPKTTQDQQQSMQDMRQRLSPAIAAKRVDVSSSDSDSDSDDDDSNSFPQKTQAPSKKMSPEKATQDRKKPMQDMRQRLAPAIAPKRAEDESSSDSDDSKCSPTPSKEMPPKTTQDQQQSMQDMRQRLSPAIAAKRVDDSSSDSDSDSDDDDSNSFPQKTQAPSKEMLPNKTTQDQQRPMQYMRQRLPPVTPAKRVDESSSDSDSDDDDGSNSFPQKTQAPSKEMLPKTTTQDQQRPMQDMRQRLPPATPAKRVDESSSDSDSDDDDDSNSFSHKAPTPSKGMSRRTIKQNQQRPKQDMQQQSSSAKRVDDSCSDSHSNSSSQQTQTSSKETPLRKTTQDQQQPMQDMRQRLFPAIAATRVDESSSDSDDSD